MNKYHEDDSINEMLSMLDNAHDIFLSKYGKDYPIISSNIQSIFQRVLSVVKEESPEGLKIE